MAGAVGDDSSGLHTRAGNSMQRTRDGVLDGALICLARDGVRGSTMGGIALAGGVAKATLYNHFRTKPDVWAALIDREVRRIVEDALVVPDRAGALALAAQQLGSLEVVRVLATREPESLLPLLAPKLAGTSPSWDQARQAIAVVLASGADDAVVDLVLRWLVSQLLAPQPAVELGRAAALLAVASYELVSSVAGSAALPDSSVHAD